MKVVIDIPTYVYLLAEETDTIADADNEKVAKAIKNGTPLPEGHGRLIDADRICKAIYAEDDNITGIGMTHDEMDAYNDGIDQMYLKIEQAPTIIEAEDEQMERNSNE